jgi:hypothetical protein
MDRITHQSPRQRGYGPTSSLRNDSLKHTRKHERRREESNQGTKLPGSGGLSGQVGRTVRKAHADSLARCRGQSARTTRTVRPEATNRDEDMTPMHTTMISAWNGVEEVQQRFPSQEGGARLIRFESPRWRPKAIEVRVQFGVQEQCAIKRTPRSHTESVLDVLYMVGSRIS